MAANTKQIKGDVDRKPSPQYYNPVADEYEYLHGENGASRHILYSSDGQPITSSGNKLAVRASEIETLLSDIESKDFATQTTLAAILNKIIAAPATEAKQTALNALIGEVQAAPTANTLLARLKNLETKVDAIIADGVQLSGSKGEIKIINLTDTSEVAAGVYVEVSTVVPANKKWTILDWLLSVLPPDNATTGTHRVFTTVGDIAFGQFDFKIAYNKRFDYTYGQFYDANSGNYLSGATIIPDDKTLWPKLLRGCIASSGKEIKFRYYNSTNVVQTRTRIIKLLVLEEDMTA